MAKEKRRLQTHGGTRESKVGPAGICRQEEETAAVEDPQTATDIDGYSSSDEEIIEEEQEDVSMDSIQQDEISDPKPRVRLFRPTVDVLEEGEELVVDEGMYEINHKFGLGDPCVCFDIVPDLLGAVRQKGPHTLTLVAGSQAEQRKNNGIIVAKSSKIRRTFVNESDSEYSDSDSEEDDDDESPSLVSQKIHTQAEINAIKVCPQVPWLLAAFLDDSNIIFHSIKNQLAVLDDPTKFCDPHQSVLHTMAEHSAEGFALQWNPSIEGQLLSGSRDRTIRMLNPVQGGWSLGPCFRGHTGSVEGLSWKANDNYVFASAGADHTIRLWDTRHTAAVDVISEAHNGDVNVVSFNRLDEQDHILSGGDDGTTKVRDIRMPQQILSEYNWHRKPICAADWHPIDGSMYLSAGWDDQLTIWSLDVEAAGDVDCSELDFPEQLMFQHLGLNEVTEAKWHPQIPGLVICNGATDFSIFKPVRVMFGD